MCAKQACLIWVVFSHPDHYHRYQGDSAAFRQRIAHEISLCQDKLTLAFAQDPGFILHFMDATALVTRLQQQKDHPDLVLFVMESRNFEEGIYSPPLNEFELKAYLKSLSIPYSGCDGLSLFADYDKSLQYALALSCGIATPAQFFIAPSCDPTLIAWSLYPAFIKPCLHGDSIGIRPSSVVHHQGELLHEVARLRALFPNEPLLLQEFLEGGEYTIGIMGNWDAPDCQTLPIIQIGYDKSEAAVPVLTHDAKNNPDSVEYMQDYYHIATLPPALEQQIRHDTLAIYKRMKGRGYARADWRLDKNGTAKFLEINALPDIMDEASSIVKMYRHKTGKNQGDFFKEIIRCGLMPENNRPQSERRATSLTPL